MGETDRWQQIKIERQEERDIYIYIYIDKMEFVECNRGRNRETKHRTRELGSNKIDPKQWLSAPNTLYSEQHMV